MSGPYEYRPHSLSFEKVDFSDPGREEIVSYKTTKDKVYLLQVNIVASTFFVFQMHFLYIPNYVFRVSFLDPYFLLLYC